ncbi:hypothetical protein [Herbaspirillum frisingense]|uniref:hypothetical protein n=1 Tax=Herbaspirillum frisingense TaxID=92645 RepID=UPI0039B014EB
MTDSEKLDALVALIRRRPGLRKAQLCDALDIDDEPLTQLLALAQLEGQIVSKSTEGKNGLMLPEYHAKGPGALGWQSGSEGVKDTAPPPAAALSVGVPASRNKAAASPTKKPRRGKRTISREAEATAFLAKHGPATPEQMRMALDLRKGYAVSTCLAVAIKAGRILVQDGLYALAAEGSELIKASSSPARDSVASLDSTPSAGSQSGGGGGLVVAQQAEQTNQLTWSIFPDGHVGIFTAEAGILRQHLSLSQADVVGLHAFLSQTKPVWNHVQAQEQA